MIASRRSSEITLRHRALDVLKLVLLLLVVYWITALVVQRMLIFPSAMVGLRETEAPAEAPGTEHHWLETDEGRTEYVLRLAPGASAETPAGLVVFAHGNAELIDDQEWGIELFTRLGYSVALCEFRGYGRSKGSPSEEHIVGDFEAMLHELEQRPEIDWERLVYFGRSLGGGVACSLARRIEPKAIILQSTFRSMTHMARSFLLPPLLVRDPFRNEQFLASYDGPVLIMHGERDSVIPFAHGERLSKVAKHARFLTFDCDHNDFPLTDPRVLEALAQLLKLDGNGP